MRDTRVLHIINSLDRGGAESNLARLCAEGAACGVANTVLTLQRGGALRESVAQHARVVAVTNVFDMRRALSRRSSAAPDLVVGWMYAGSVAASAVASRRLPVVWCLRHVPSDVASESRTTRASLRCMRRWCGPASRRRPSLVVVNSPAGQAAHESLGLHARYQVIANGVDVDRFAPDAQRRRSARRALELGDDDVALLHVARAHPHKGHRFLLDAAMRVMHSAPTAKLVLVGAGVDSLEHPIFAVAANRVRRFGDRDDLETFYAAADALVSPSLTESFPTVVIEAMSCGVPCVVTDVGASAEIVGDSGVVIEPGSVDALECALARMVAATGAAREELGRAARRRVIEHYTLAQMAAAFAGAYRSLLAEA